MGCIDQVGDYLSSEPIVRESLSEDYQSVLMQGEPRDRVGFCFSYSSEVVPCEGD